ncbi:diphthine--ammonia ligase [Spirosoma luteolum]
MTPMTKPTAVFCWSGGKDSALALHRVQQAGAYEVRYLLTTVNDALARISMHGVREALLREQAMALGLPLLTARVTDSTYEGYERAMQQALETARAEGIETVIYGDIFLEDLRRYREASLAPLGMTAVFPLWQQNTHALIADFVAQGFRTVLCCTNDAWLGRDWVGAEIDATFAGRLPAGVDPCGENGEYHTFCYDGPIFTRPVALTRGEVVYKPLDIPTGVDTTGVDTSGVDMPAERPVTRGFWYVDLLPAGS